MSKIKRAIEDAIAELAAKSGYAEDFLMDMLFTCMGDADRDGEPFDFRQFCGITLERDW